MESARINAPLLGEYQGRPVRVIGKLTKLDSQSEGVLNSAGPITIRFQSGEMVIGHYYEVIGTVGSDNSLNVHQLIDFGEDISETAVEALVKFSRKTPELFAS